MFTALLAIVGALAIAKLVIEFVFPVWALRIRTVVLLKSLTRALDKEAKRHQQ